HPRLLVFPYHQTCLNPTSAYSLIPQFPKSLIGTAPSPLSSAPSRPSLCQQTHPSGLTEVTLSPTMDVTSEQSGQTNQAAPTPAVSSQTANPGQEQAALGWLAGVHLGFSLWCPAPSQPPVPSATPTSMLPLTQGVTAVAALVSTELASLVAASVSATAVASVANKAFPELGHEGLKGQQIVQTDWPAIALEASKRSTTIIDQFYAELRNKDRVLTYVSQVAGAVADKGSGKAHGSNFLTAFWGPGLKQHREICQRMLDSLSMLIESGQRARDNFRTSVGNFLEEQLEHLTILVKLEHSNDDSGATVQTTGPGDFFQLVIDRLNKEVSESEAGMFWGRASACSDPEKAAFVRGIYTSRGAGVMFDGAFISALDRLDRLSSAVVMEMAWVEGELKMWLDHLPSKAGCPTTTVELQTKMEEVVSMTEKWQRKLQEMYYG
ncbi:hypothetical protein F5144DRAFT_481152, partial [Chaetomium tenue]